MTGRRFVRIVPGALAMAGILVLDGCAPVAPMRDTPSLGVVDTALANGAPEFALRIAQNMIA